MNYFEDNSMSEFICQICLNSFNQRENVPKILLCGHTLCKTCVTNIKSVSNSLCPICKRSIEGTEPATNYSLLKLIDVFTDTPATLRNDVAKIYINRISKSLLDVQLHISIAIKEATSLRAFGYENEYFAQELEDAMISFNDIETNMTTLKEKLFQSGEAPEVNINIKTLKLPQLAERIYKGEKIFAVSYINDVKQYGKVFKRGRNLCISALSEEEIPKRSSFFWLCDLQRYHISNILPYIAVYDERTQQSEFIIFGGCDEKTLDMFTGESGQSLKNCTCFWKDKVSTLVIKMEKNKCLNIKIRQTRAGKLFKECVEKGLPISAEISVTNHQRNPVVDVSSVGKFFRDNNLTFLFPKDDDARIVKEHGIILMTNGNKDEEQ